jgi:hypothetical protein
VRKEKSDRPQAHQGSRQIQESKGLKLFHYRLGWKILAFLFLSQVVFADVAPISLTFFGMYGTPVQPLGLASSTTNGFGFDLLGEWNPSYYFSLGLSYEEVTFYDFANFTVPMVNLESRIFPLENGKKSFSPYVYGGVGLNTSSTGGPVQLKAGIGSRVSIANPIFFDIAAGSHWIQSPNAFQFVDIRAGLGCSIDFKPAPEKSPTPVMTPTPGSPTPLAQVSVTPTVTTTPTPIQTPEEISLEESPTPIPLIEAAPVTTIAGVKKYYKLGMRAFLARNYAMSFKYLKKSLSTKEIHGAAYYYAETYATLGVIYQFHSHKIKDHDLKALLCYKKALAIDPTTKSAKHYYKKLKAKVAAAAKKKHKALPAPTPTVSVSVDTGGSSASPPSNSIDTSGFSNAKP